jgi:hypothetical protein
MSRIDRLLLPGLALLALVLRGLGIGVADLAHDEPFTVVMAHRDLGDLFAQLREENNPPLHFLLMHYWCKLVPLEEGWLRAPSALFGALAVVPLYRIGHALRGTRVALVASLVFLFSAYHQGFAQEVRVYALLTWLTTAAFWLLWRCTRPGVVQRMLLALCSVALVYAHFMGWAVLGLLVLTVIGIPEFRPARKALAAALACTLVLFLPYAGIFVHRVGASAAAGTWLTSPEPEELYNMVWRWTNVPVLAVAALALVAGGLWWGGRHDPGIRMGAIWGLLPLLVVFAVSHRVPLFLDRYLVFAAPGFALLLAVSMELVPWPHVRWSLVIGAVFVLGMALTFPYGSTSAERPSAVMRQVERLRNGGMVLVQPPWYLSTLAWQVDRSLLTAPKDLVARTAALGIHGLRDGEDLAGLGSLPDTVVLVDAWAALTDPNAQVLGHLRVHYATEESCEPSPKVVVRRFTR